MCNASIQIYEHKMNWSYGMMGLWGYLMVPLSLQIFIPITKYHSHVSITDPTDDTCHLIERKRLLAPFERLVRNYNPIPRKLHSTINESLINHK